MYSCLTSTDLAYKYNVDIEWVRETKFNIMRQIATQDDADAVHLPRWPVKLQPRAIPSGRQCEEGEDVVRASIEHYYACLTTEKMNAGFKLMNERNREEWKRRELEIRVARQAKKKNPGVVVDIPTHFVEVMKYAYPRRKQPEEDYFEPTNLPCIFCDTYGYQCVINVGKQGFGCYGCASKGRICWELSLQEDPKPAVHDVLNTGKGLRRDILICLYNLREVAFELDLLATRPAPNSLHVVDGVDEELRVSEGTKDGI